MHAALDAFGIALIAIGDVLTAAAAAGVTVLVLLARREARPRLLGDARTVRVLPSGRARGIEPPRQVLNIRSEPAHGRERGSEDIRTPKLSRPPG